ncbi:MAG: hypothetical protein GYB64_11365 [Chloroflexi bacterium]|nr:hypothetical protein [Chloroflexota bacterium]
MPMFYFRPMKFFPEEEPIDYHRFVILPVPFAVEDRRTAITVNIIILTIGALGVLTVALVVLGLAGVELPLPLFMPWAE